VLAWPSGQKDEGKAKEAEDARKVFEENLTKEGLEIEHDIKVPITLCLCCLLANSQFRTRKLVRKLLLKIK